MKVAILSESAADDAAIRILVDHLLGTRTQAPKMPPLRSRGWPSVRQVLPKVLKHLHYHTDADALVVVVDADASPIHKIAHVGPGPCVEACRLCALRANVDLTMRDLQPRPTRSPMETALGLAVPAIEAWLRCGLPGAISEQAWARTLTPSSAREHGIRLKREVYGSDRAPGSVKRQRAIEEAQRIGQDLADLESNFPVGFGALARDIRGWHAGWTL